MQLPAIESARRMGCTVHVADGNRHCPGAACADVFHEVDLRDQEELVVTAGKIPELRAVFTAGTDFSTAVARIAAELGLPGVTPAASRRATDKGVMRETLHAAGVAAPRFFTVNAEEMDYDFGLETMNVSYPVVVKPVDNMGARGVRRVERQQELGEAIRDAFPLSHCGRVIVEEFIRGEEYSLDAVVTGGLVRITGLAERHIFFPPHFIEMGHTIPATLSNDEEEALRSEFIAAIHALGIDQGAAKGDIFLERTLHGPRAVVGEVAARLSGGYMSGWTYPLSTGVPLTAIGLRIALGEDLEDELFRPTRSLVVAERALISSPGIVERIEIPERYPEGVHHVFIRVKTGDRVRPPSNNVEKVANVIAAGDTAEEAENRAIEALDTIVVHLRHGEEETERFLFGREGSGPFRAYRPAEEEDRKKLEQMPWYHGNGNNLIHEVSAGRPLPVVSESRSIRWFRCYPVPEASLLMRDLTARGLITFDASIGRPAAAARLFWSAFAAGGRQGVLYLLESLRAGTIPAERGV
jgi:biotin carboxylase